MGVLIRVRGASLVLFLLLLCVGLFFVLVFVLTVRGDKGCFLNGWRCVCVGFRRRFGCDVRVRLSVL